MATHSVSPTSAIQDSVREFRAAPWVMGTLLIRLVPLFLMGLGVDFSSGHAPLSPEVAATRSAAQLGVSVLITKPIDEDQLLQTVEPFLSRKVHHG